MTTTTHRSKVNHPTVQNNVRHTEIDNDLWAVVFDGRIRVNVSAPDPETAIQRASESFPGLAVAKVYLR